MMVMTDSEDRQADSQSCANGGTPHERRRDIVTILLQRMSRRKHTFAEVTGLHDDVDVLEANGSVQSIIDWAVKAAKLDRKQRRAFEVIARSFVLTFYNDNEEGVGDCNDEALDEEQRKLEMLVETSKCKSRQLICLLHGPGGSGKQVDSNGSTGRVLS